jgi:hypothetical protein
MLSKEYKAVLRIRIRNLAWINDTVSTFLVCVKAMNTEGIYVDQLFGPWRYFLEHIFIKKNVRKKLAENLLGSGSGTGSGRFRKSDPDPVKNRPGPQHWYKESHYISWCSRQRQNLVF